MAVDYAKRGNPKKKPTRKSSPRKGAVRKKNQSQQSAPFKVVFLLILVIAVFTAFLWFLRNGGEEVIPSVSSGSPESATPTVVAPQLDPLPEVPQERWGYISDLENKQVEVDVPESAESRRRLMQCGSFRQFGDADNLRARIAMHGFESQVRESHGSNGRWYRVILGPFENLREAQRVNNQLQRSGIYGCQIWLWNLD
ncbi:MAG: SPOR domain-containing protein [Gammaproteobacteria bacterium]|nr:SPOR domain-containing protein [Gammaproteobacteria bacterium]